MSDLDLENEAKREHEARTKAAEQAHALAVGRMIARYTLAAFVSLVVGIATCDSSPGKGAGAGKEIETCSP